MSTREPAWSAAGYVRPASICRMHGGSDRISRSMPASGALGALIGREGDFAIRGGYTRSFSRPGLNDFIGVFGANPGITMDVTRSEGNGNLGAVPVLLRDTSRLGAPSFNDTPTYPM